MGFNHVGPGNELFQFCDGKAGEETLLLAGDFLGRVLREGIFAGGA